jgi:hypothetical protein
MIMRGTFVLAALALAGLSTHVWADKTSESPVKVFILVGQSNMEGKGTIKHLEQVVSENAQAYGNLKSNGKWVERDDVWIDYLGNQGRRKKGKLTVGYGSPEDRIGPELGFGNLVGDVFEGSVLIIKYAVGGRAIAMEFRPPSSGPIDPSTIGDKLQQEIESGKRNPGDEYRKMMAHIKSVMGNLRESVPGYKGGPVELAGFVWFQGWNDQYNGFEKHYQTNMANFIRDVRKDLKSPALPFVIGGMGQGGDRPMYKSAIIRKAQRATAEEEEFKNNNVRYVPTAPYWREGKQGDGEYHYNGNAEIFLLMGKAFGKAILEMQPSAASKAGSKPRSTPEKVEAVRFDPVVQHIEGWTVHVDPQMLKGEHSQAGAEALKILANHLQRIAILVPREQLAKLRTIEFWIEHAHPQLGGMQYHPNRKWLTDRGHDRRLAKKVHITRAAQLLSRQQMLKHPAVILHELAHGYHDQYLSFNNPRIIEAYKKAMGAGIYDKVLLYTGKQVRHYAATDHKEYFAEGTESFFYRNDFYPFVGAELAEHDPVLYNLLTEIWGSLK